MNPLKGWSLTRRGKAAFAFVALLIIIPIMVYGVSLYQNKIQDELPLLERITSEKAKDEVMDLVSEVGKLVDLPQGEVPALATVTEVDQLRNQDFYKNAQNGDKVLIYQDAHMAYLYRPTSRKLIAVAPVEFEEEVRKKKEEEAQRGVASASDSAVVGQEISATTTPSPTTGSLRELNLQ